MTSGELLIRFQLLRGRWQVIWNSDFSWNREIDPLFHGHRIMGSKLQLHLELGEKRFLRAEHVTKDLIGILKSTGSFWGVNHEYLGLSENVGYIPNEIAIFHRDKWDNDQQNHWDKWGTPHFQTNPFDQNSWDVGPNLMLPNVDENLSGRPLVKAARTSTIPVFRPFGFGSVLGRVQLHILWIFQVYSDWQYVVMSSFVSIASLVCILLLL